MRPTSPENFDGDATTDGLDPTWKVQVDLSRLYSTRLAGLLAEPYLGFPKRFFAVLDVRDHHLVLTLCFKLLSYLHLSRQIMAENTANFCENRKNHGKDDIKSRA